MSKEAAKIAAKKDAETKKQVAQRSAAAKKAQVATKQASIEAAVVDIKTGAVHVSDDGKILDTTNSSALPIMATQPVESRYRTTGAFLGFQVDPAFAAAKPEAAELIVTAEHIEFSKNFSHGDDNAIVKAISTLSGEIETMQGKIACACAGLAFRLQEQGPAAFQIIERFFNALEPLGKSLSAVRVPAIKSWFIDMAAVKLDKVEGKGTIPVFDSVKWAEMNTKFGRDKDAWLKRRISKPYWIDRKSVV